MIWWAVGGCTPDTTDKGPTDTTTTPTADTGTGPIDTGTRPSPDLLLDTTGNYHLTVAYTVPVVDVRAGYDGLVTWSGITTDAWGALISPSAVSRVVLLEVAEAPDAVAARLAKDDLGFDLRSQWELDPSGGVFAHLSDFQFGTTPFDPAAFLVEDPTHAWVVALAEPLGARLHLRSALVLNPKDTSAASTAAFTDGAATFSGTAVFDGTPLVTWSGWEQFTLDWAGVTTDALGKPLDTDVVDQLFVAKFASPPDPAQVWDLPAFAEEVYFLEVGGSHDARLEFGRDAGGANFPGFSADGTWIVGGRCTTCFTPFPAFVATVDAR